MNKPDPDEDLRQLLERDDTCTTARHDEAVLAAARAVAGARRERAAESRKAQAVRFGWKVPVALAASFVAGALTAVALDAVQWTSLPGSESGLMLPLDTTRNTGLREIPVEQAEPAEWYRYIQELIVAGETQEAEHHLSRFNELHPDYAHQP